MALVFDLHIDCSGPAFEDGNEGQKKVAGSTEVPRILREVAEIVGKSERFKGKITAIDGTTCGSWSFRNDG